jgi:DNA replication and repair protein RecF
MPPAASPFIAEAKASVRLKTLSVRDFRNIATADLTFPVQGVVIIGDNGQGKTNLLEAVAFLGTLRSVRNARDKDLVRHDAVAAHLRGGVDEGAPREIGIGIERVSGRKKLVIDGVEITRQVDALGVLPSVSWSPTDVSLVAGGPVERRRYLDVTLSLCSRAYVNALRRYRAALDRRNATLRDVARRGRSEGAVAAWEPALAEHGAVLVDTRRAWTDEHGAEFTRLCAAIGERASATLAYESDVAEGADTAPRLAELLSRERAHDVQRGTTSVGPHRDDLNIALDAHDARTFGSAGQQRTAAIALRLLEARTLRATGRGHPVLLLDDPFAELDATRTARTLALLAEEDVGQVMLAVPRETEIPAHFARLTRWRVQGGVVATS